MNEESKKWTSLNFPLNRNCQYILLNILGPQLNLLLLAVIEGSGLYINWK